jgi:Ni,Fe-hydrogenase III large subunit/Ni,Fe-hydrogenase III component G
MQFGTLTLQPLTAPLPIGWVQVGATGWLTHAQAVHEQGGALVALWASHASEIGADGALSVRATAINAAYSVAQGLVWLQLPLADGPQPGYPDLSGLFACAGRMQRAAADLSGVVAQGATDTRAWLNHGTWTQSPLLQDAAQPFAAPQPAQDYPFVPVQGEGVHEIPVGPVHAGIIEPGHFRFSVVGEKILRLEQRLGYTHKGVEQRITQFAPLQAHRLAGRVSGDSTVTYAWAYCMALESACGVLPPQRASWLRVLLLERERVANHLGDLGAMGNDVAFAFALAQFARLREDWVRTSKAIFGHRWLMDCVVPGGVAVDVDTAQSLAMLQQCDRVEAELRTLMRIFEDHAGLQDRFVTTGRVMPALAKRLGLTGMPARASGQPHDMRADYPWQPYASLQIQKVVHHQGDVAARAHVRFDEVLESLRLIRRVLEQLPSGPIHTALDLPTAPSRGAGCVEGWRGPLWVALELAGPEHDHRILRCHLHDPSWQNWPVLEHAVIGNIVADFPIINKSFNLSYSGHDL